MLAASESREGAKGAAEMFASFSISGSGQEFDGTPILRSFPVYDEIGLGKRHTLSLEEQVA